jgi:hypothetical protein
MWYKILRIMFEKVLREETPVMLLVILNFGLHICWIKEAHHYLDFFINGKLKKKTVRGINFGDVGFGINIFIVHFIWF